MKIAILDDYQNLACKIADWSELEGEHEIKVFREHLGARKNVTAALNDYDILAVTRERTLLDRATLAALPNLKLIATAGMRNAAIDLEYCKEHGIVVVGTGGSAQATPELAWGLMLALARHIPTENARMRDGSWITTLGKDLAGSTLGIIGLGRLGSEMANIGHAFRMNVIAWSQNLTDEAAAKAGAERVEKAELFRHSDFITIHYKLSERSVGLVGAEELALMKTDAYLVNTSRGPIVDTDALIIALKDERIGGAGIDVYDVEPLPRDHPLRSCPRTVLTPHLGYVSEATYRMFYTEMVEGIESWLAGVPVRVICA